MSDLLRYTVEIIRAASENLFGLLALLAIIFGFLSFVLFRRESVKVRIFILVLLFAFGITLAFLAASISRPGIIDPSSIVRKPINPSDSNESPVDPNPPTISPEPSLPENTTEPPSQDARSLFKKGLKISSYGDYKQAVQNFTDSINIDPTRADAYLNRGLNRVELNQCEEAIKDFTQAIQQNQVYGINLSNDNSTIKEVQVKAYTELGKARAALGQTQEAIKVFKELKYLIYRSEIDNEDSRYREALAYEEALEKGQSISSECIASN